jgi:hypothetical protein
MINRSFRILAMFFVPAVFARAQSPATAAHWLGPGLHSGWIMPLDLLPDLTTIGSYSRK